MAELSADPGLLNIDTTTREVRGIVSDRSTFVTGSTLVIDGGFTAR